MDVIPHIIEYLGPFPLLSSELWDSLHGGIREMRKNLNNKEVEKFHMEKV